MAHGLNGLRGARRPGIPPSGPKLVSIVPVVILTLCWLRRTADYDELASTAKAVLKVAIKECDRRFSGDNYKAGRDNQSRIAGSDNIHCPSCTPRGLKDDLESLRPCPECVPPAAARTRSAGTG